jgi:hypothetical protein
MVRTMVHSACGRLPWPQVLTREAFEEQLGPLHELQLQQLKLDPRSLLAQFYQPGDHHGPAGALARKNRAPDPEHRTTWFAVYRPCSYASPPFERHSNCTGLDTAELCRGAAPS